LVDMGLGKRVPEKYISDTYGIPLAEEGEAVIGVPQQNVIASGQSMFAEKSEVSTDQKDIETLADNSLLDASLDLSPLQRIIDSAESYEDLQKKIKQAYGSLNLSQFRNVLERALFMAELKGRSING